MTHSRANRGTCSEKTTVTLDEHGMIQSIVVDDGCDGNLQGICTLLQGCSARDAVSRLQGIRCDDKPTSCPHQISLCLAEALENLPE